MKSFVIVFDRPRGDILELLEFAESEREAAFEQLFALERRYETQSDIEVVMLGSDSLATVKRTHTRYFKDELRKRIAALG